MSLAAGTRLGPYEILAPLGAGGMGEVYRARDSKLKREVAIKVLPDSFAGDPERMARFQREAEVLAALNHPNIAQIYGLEAGALVELAGEAVPVAEDLPDTGAPRFSVSTTGVLAYRAGGAGTTTQLTWFDRACARSGAPTVAAK